MSLPATDLPAGLPLHSVSVGAVIVRSDDHVLLVRRDDNGRLATPGGVLEVREAPVEGLRREVLEETGTHIVGEPRLTGVYKNVRRGVVSLVFRCSPRPAERLRTSCETPEVVWVPIPDALRRAHPIYAIRIADALRDDGPHVRVHDGARVLATQD
jgi:8-oxo-dGTP diphosphatase